jgi:hypothetical protein
MIQLILRPMTLAFLIAASTVDTSRAATESGLVDRLAACRMIAVDAHRLACYDEIAGRSAGGLAGASSAKLRVMTLTTLADGRLVFELEPAQQWVETEVPRQKLLLRVGDEIELRRGALGAFLLVTESGRSTRVRRLR